MHNPSATQRSYRLNTLAGFQIIGSIAVFLLLLGSAPGVTLGNPVSSLPAVDSAAIGQPRQGVPRANAQKKRTIEIDMEYISFNVKSVVVRAGETIRFILRNTSPLPHDFTIGNSIAQQGRRAVMDEVTEAGRLNGKIENSELFDGPNAVLVFPGETKELVWRFTETQRLEFGCNVPGHYELGMKGAFAVRTRKRLPVNIASTDRHPEDIIVQVPAKLLSSNPVSLPTVHAASFKTYGDDYQKLAGISHTAAVTNTKPVMPEVTPKLGPAKPQPRGGWLLQLASRRSHKLASSDWRQMTRKYPDILHGLEHKIVRANLGSLGVFYRVRAGGFPTARAAYLACARIKARGGACISVPAKR